MPRLTEVSVKVSDILRWIKEKSPLRIVVKDDAGKSLWGLRSPSFSRVNAAAVNNDGSAPDCGSYVCGVNCCARPCACQIFLNESKTSARDFPDPNNPQYPGNAEDPAEAFPGLFILCINNTRGKILDIASPGRVKLYE